MTKIQAAQLQKKWMQQGHLSCEHPIQELASSDCDEAHLLTAYHCRDCGELIVQRFKARNVPNKDANHNGLAA